MSIRFENWFIKGKRRRVIVSREKGKLQTWKFQKSSGIRRKEQAKEIYKRTKTFSETRVRLKTKKGSKNIDVDNYGFINKTTEGYTNVGIIQTKRAIEKKRHQWVAIIEIEKKVFTGYSDIKSESTGQGWGLSESGTKEQAIERAIMSARMSDVIPFYTFDFEYDDNYVKIYDRNKTSIIIGKIRTLYAQHYIQVVQ